MITVDNVLEACEIRNKLGRQTSITTMFIFDHKPMGDDEASQTHISTRKYTMVIQPGWEARIVFTLFLLRAAPL